jgi:hypothetical protein
MVETFIPASGLQILWALKLGMPADWPISGQFVIDIDPNVFFKKSKKWKT